MKEGNVTLVQLALDSKQMSYQPTQLFYITHVDNVDSILKLGVLSHDQVESRNVPFHRIYDADIVSSRSQKLAPSGANLWAFANLYFQPRNAMLYRVSLEQSVDNLAVMGVRFDLVNWSANFIALGNAASAATDIVSAKVGVRYIQELKADFAREYWSDEDGSKRRMMAEVLVPNEIPPEYVQAIYVGSQVAASKVQEAVARSGISPAPSVIVEPYMFFRALHVSRITPRLTLEQGDLFFSRMQTLTVSVNAVGVMGKGLASRAKYQFPAVYVAYQDLCRKKILKMGRPVVYKRETPFELELADQPNASLANGETWFLLFPTKHHWRENADIRGIEEGLAWLVDNYRSEEIKSIAMPALGCGLGRLDWKDVGPLMCRYLDRMDIPVQIYLPSERQIPSEYLTKEHLLP